MTFSFECAILEGYELCGVTEVVGLESRSCENTDMEVNLKLIHHNNHIQHHLLRQLQFTTTMNLNISVYDYKLINYRLIINRLMTNVLTRNTLTICVRH